jgi:hypothetical protein
MPHLVLLGDSIFDNQAYVGRGPDVVTQLAPLLPADWRATLAAVDGAVIADVPRQLARLPVDATHLVVSAGGNDALGHVGLLERPATSSAQVLGWLADAAGEFEARYRRLLAALEARALPTTLCTIYNGNLGPPVQRLATTALAVFNDVILRLAAERALPVIELRLVCAEPADYANPIEPSVQGGAKIARAIERAVVRAPRSPASGHGARTPMLTPAPGAVTGMPRLLLRLEGVAVLLLAVLLYARGGHSWVLFGALFLVPDVSFAAYLAGARAGALAYNVVHSYAAPALLAVGALATDRPLAVALVWAAHIGFDRALGYGLKYPTAFADTHLGRLRGGAGGGRPGAR